MAKRHDILLVHGSWHGGWAFDDIGAALREAGHRVLAPCLQGLGRDAANLHRDIGLWTHVDQLEGIVRGQDLRNLILVGHSYGGALAHGLEGRIEDRLHAVVHLEGAIPAPGRSIMDLWPEERRRSTKDALQKQGDGWRVPPPHPSTWGNLSDEQIAWLLPKLTDQSIRTYQDILPPDLASAACPHFYLYADDREPQPYQAVIDRFSKNPDWQLAATPGGHELIFTNPEAVLRVIDIAVAGGRLPSSL